MSGWIKSGLRATLVVMAVVLIDPSISGWRLFGASIALMAAVRMLAEDEARGMRLLVQP